MANSCEICGKGTVFGRRISHAHNVSNRTFQANIQKIRTRTPSGSKRTKVCTRCLRSGKVQKVVR